MNGVYDWNIHTLLGMHWRALYIVSITYKPVHYIGVSVYYLRMHTHAGPMIPLP